MAWGMIDRLVRTRGVFSHPISGQPVDYDRGKIFSKRGKKYTRGRKFKTWTEWKLRAVIFLDDLSKFYSNFFLVLLFCWAFCLQSKPRENCRVYCSKWVISSLLPSFCTRFPFPLLYIDVEKGLWNSCSESKLNLIHVLYCMDVWSVSTYLQENLYGYTSLVSSKCMSIILIRAKLKILTDKKFD